MSEPIRILHVLGSLNRGGAQTMIMNLYRNIDHDKVQFDFVLHTENFGDYAQEVLDFGGRIFSISRYTGMNHYRYKDEWVAFYDAHPEYKIIHGHVRSTATIYLKIAMRKGLSTIAHSHNTSSGSGLSAIVKNVMQYPIRYSAKEFFACSEFAGEWLFGKKVCKKENFYILKNAINISDFTFDNAKRNEKRKELEVRDKFVIGHIGRFHPQKNHEYLVKVFKSVHEKNQNAVLLLIGEGENQQKIKNDVNELGLSESVIFSNTREDVGDLMKAMDVFVFPSLFEGLGMVVVEAQASGLKCIVADTIPKEAYVTNLVEPLSLSAAPEIWADKILQSSTGYSRVNTFEEIRNNGYDITKTSEWLERFYNEKAI